MPNLNVPAQALAQRCLRNLICPLEHICHPPWLFGTAELHHQLLQSLCAQYFRLQVSSCFSGFVKRNETAGSTSWSIDSKGIPRPPRRRRRKQFHSRTHTTVIFMRPLHYLALFLVSWRFVATNKSWCRKRRKRYPSSSKLSLSIYVDPGDYVGHRRAMHSLEAIEDLSSGSLYLFNDYLKKELVIPSILYFWACMYSR